MWLSLRVYDGQTGNHESMHLRIRKSARLCPDFSNGLKVKTFLDYLTNCELRQPPF